MYDMKIKSEEKLSLYYIDEKYINFLNKIDNKVPQKQNYYKNRKFFCGVVLSVGDNKYFAPVSSCKTNGSVAKF